MCESTLEGQPAYNYNRQRTSGVARAETGILDVLEAHWRSQRAGGTGSQDQGLVGIGEGHGSGMPFPGVYSRDAGGKIRAEGASLVVEVLKSCGAAEPGPDPAAGPRLSCDPHAGVLHWNLVSRRMHYPVPFPHICQHQPDHLHPSSLSE